ncbi:uncharacterized protein C8Q71DRAFT_707525 [Rhodofomes roseus]|uniref:Uncharacterized protein n=1 Tax=Rhodofomes roseus TaxID=34475 RepID=A0ABQ8KHF4_9APHY|nr:uncharacterized protein C8Q71DRAFT_707525 [Rhodofomes roseus]KAH9837263.1 hypothetical protein C8Q71DRAFT_707525 [Rhodofomes roseus]
MHSAPHAYTAFDAVAAADPEDHVNVITSPTQTWIPEPPIITYREITTYRDGWWGPQEYTRWPQMFNESVFHHACIPLRGSRDAPGDSVYNPLPDRLFVDSARLNPLECETPGFGRMDGALLSELRKQAISAIDKYRTAEVLTQVRNQKVDFTLGKMLQILLRNAVDRLEYLPATETHVLVTARMAHRLILEICGLSIYYTVVVPRLGNPDPDVIHALLRVRGAFVRNGATAQLLYRLGIPFWFMQRYRPDIHVQRVVRLKPWTDELDSEPVGMRVPKSWYDADGTNQDPARWVHPSLSFVCSRLCSTRLPCLQHVPVSDAAPDAKRQKGVSGLATQQATTKANVSSKPKRVRRGSKKHAGPAAQRANTWPRPPHAAFTYQPPPVDILADTPNWRSALQAVSPLPHPPPQAAVYYFPPPFLFINSTEKLGRYVHNYTRIRMFCRQRLLEPHFDGRPLKMSEWRHALYGDYKLDEPSTDGSDGPVVTDKARLRHEHKEAIRGLFAKSAGLVSYSADMVTDFQRDRITAATAASDRGLAREVIWEVNEMNWRCELRALDALLVDAGRSGWLQWEREQVVCEVWRETAIESAYSALFCFPRSTFRWTPVTEVGWRERARNLYAFIRVMSRWPDFPSALRDRLHPPEDHDSPEQFDRLEKIATQYYVSMFVKHYHRLPCVPLNRLVGA